MLKLVGIVILQLSGSEKGIFWKRGLFRKVNFLEVLENLEILEILENPRLWKAKENPTIF